MPLRLCLVSYLISKQATGLSTYIRTLVSKLLDDGHSVTVLATDLEYAGTGASGTVEIDPRAHFKRFPVRGTLNRRFYRCPELTVWLRDHADEYDLVDIQGIWAFVNFGAADTARRRGLPYVITPHGMLTRWDWAKRKLFKDILYRWRGKRMLEDAAAVRFLSQGEFANSAIALKRSVTIIPNAVAPASGEVPEDVRADVRASLGMAAEAPLVLFMGRISHQKGVLELVKAVERVAAEQDVHLVLMGPADQEPMYAAAVQAYMAESPAAARFHYLGPVFGQEKFAFLHAADLFATLSRNEGLSLAALEALAEGLPVLLSVDANLPEVAKYDAGRIVGCDPQEAAGVLAEMFADPAKLRLLRGNAKRLHRERFSWAAVLPQLLAMYRSSLRQRSHGES